MASEFARRLYHDKLGLECQALPYPVDWECVRTEDREPRYVTFVNPAPYKGAFYPFSADCPRAGGVGGPAFRYWVWTNRRDQSRPS